MFVIGVHVCMIPTYLQVSIGSDLLQYLSTYTFIMISVTHTHTLAHITHTHTTHMLTGSPPPRPPKGIIKNRLAPPGIKKLRKARVKWDRSGMLVVPLSRLQCIIKLNITVWYMLHVYIYCTCRCSIPNDC